MFVVVSLAAVFSIITQRSSRALRDDTKNGCEGDYMFVVAGRNAWPPPLNDTPDNWLRLPYMQNNYVIKKKIMRLTIL